MLSFLFISQIKYKYNIPVDPAFRLNAFPTRWRARLLFEKRSLWVKKNDLESPLIFVLFLKG